MSSMPDHSASGHDPRAVDEVVVGVDTHKDVHVAAVVTALGAVVGTRSFPTTAAGYQQLLDWARAFCRLRRAGIECTGSYGVGLTRHLRRAGVEVIEVNQPDRGERRRRGKTDAIDAEAAARAVLSGRATSMAKSGDGPVETLRMLRLAKDSAIKARTQAINQLKAVLVRADPAVRDKLSGLSTPRLIRRCIELATTTPANLATPAAYTLNLLAARVAYLTGQIEDLTARITEAIGAHTPTLLEQYGVGPDTAGALLLAVGDNPERSPAKPASQPSAA